MVNAFLAVGFFEGRDRRGPREAEAAVVEVCLCSLSTTRTGETAIPKAVGEGIVIVVSMHGGEKAS